MEPAKGVGGTPDSGRELVDRPEFPAVTGTHSWCLGAGSRLAGRGPSPGQGPNGRNSQFADCVCIEIRRRAWRGTTRRFGVAARTWVEGNGSVRFLVTRLESGASLASRGVNQAHVHR